MNKHYTKKFIYVHFSIFIESVFLADVELKIVITHPIIIKNVAIIVWVEGCSLCIIGDRNTLVTIPIAANGAIVD